MAAGLETVKDRFIKELNLQTDMYLELKELILEEQKALKSRNPEIIQELVRRQEELTEKINLAEKKKMELFAEISEKAGFAKDENAVLKDVLRRLAPEDANDIEKEVKKLLDAAKEADGLNAGNKHLIKNYMDYIGFVNNIRTKSQPENITYNSQGAMKKDKEPPKGPGIDTKI
ncbi:MAG: flagellar export chaperone FlgN [Candidatus Goldiibacteriota bacterium]